MLLVWVKHMFASKKKICTLASALDSRKSFISRQSCPGVVEMEPERPRLKMPLGLAAPTAKFGDAEGTNPPNGPAPPVTPPNASSPVPPEYETKL